MYFKKGAVAALLTVAAAACNRGQAQPPGAQGMPPSAVMLAVAQAEPVEDASEYVATLKSLHSTTIQPQIEGQITQIFVKSGDRVKQGAPLMQIDPRRQQAAVSSQEAERASKEANVNYARQQAQRASELLKAGAISKQEQEQAETALRTAEADLQSLQAQVQQQQVQLRYYTVAAPTAGIVGDVPVRVGNQVSLTTMLTTIDQNETLEVYVSVPIERAPELKIGLPLQIRNSEEQELATSKISFVSPHVDDQTQTVLVKGQVKNDGSLRASQFVRARIIWKVANGLLIPVTAVLRINGQFFAFVAESAGGKLVAKQRAVKVGEIVGDDYVVLDGLKPGERVVVSGAQKLADGAPIAEAPPQPPAAPASPPR
ncbi:MAG TPA: efflux RND transporter periplasmic adaptor subunit [Vicinamibacterales bacterium]|nr:efflux RND transporter periplasmic adaptor subunit [Vicinamibacterales bacterium]